MSSMSKIAFIFPGQGAQYIGMAKEFYDAYPESKEVFETASKMVGLDLANLCFTENEQINITEYTQIAMLTACISIYKRVETLGIRPDVTAGLSLGEYPALVASGVLDFKDAAKVVRARGILMQEAVPAGQGAMSAVLGLDNETVKKICEETQGIVTVANYNCPGQIVISGEVKAVEEAGIRIKEAGAKRVIPLNVSGPFHSPLLKEAGIKLGEILDEVVIHEPNIPYVDNTNGAYIRSAEGIRDLLTTQVFSSVMWQQSVETMLEDGVDTFIEIGPGKTLTSFVKKMSKEATLVNVEHISDLDKLLEVVPC